MITLTRLRRPEGFADSIKWAMNSSTGELLHWTSSTLNPKDFSMDQDGNVWHSCDDEPTFSRVLRNGLPANNFFEETPKVAVLKKKCQPPAASTLPPPPFSASHHGPPRRRKKKHKKQKYKNSNRRRLRTGKPRRKKKLNKKTRKKERVLLEKFSLPTPPIYCQYCSCSSIRDNIFLNPHAHHCCDFCDSCFSGEVVQGHICGYCLYRRYRRAFCDSCKENLGEWSPEWRGDIGLHDHLHPPRCFCKNCTSLPCNNCGMDDHTRHRCPWFIPDGLSLTKRELRNGTLEAIADLVDGHADPDDTYFDACFDAYSDAYFDAHFDAYSDAYFAAEYATYSDFMRNPYLY